MGLLICCIRIIFIISIIAKVDTLGGVESQILHRSTYQGFMTTPQHLSTPLIHLLIKVFSGVTITTTT